MIVTLDPYLTTLICHAMHFFTVISNGYVTAHHFTIYRIVASFYFDSLQSKTKDAYYVHGVTGGRICNPRWGILGPIYPEMGNLGVVC